jgi:hypothetical protein
MLPVTTEELKKERPIIHLLCEEATGVSNTEVGEAVSGTTRGLARGAGVDSSALDGGGTRGSLDSVTGTEDRLKNW